AEKHRQQKRRDERQAPNRNHAHPSSAAGRASPYAPPARGHRRAFFFMYMRARRRYIRTVPHDDLRMPAEQLFQKRQDGLFLFAIVLSVFHRFPMPFP
ncbi:hypothetical protein, partial [Hominenteromicrobium sp.]|uniref:hypothetical protein n=1 Tax=Hominenteromicrobium sp. TaxID=3073581 RepID=UPI003AB3A310